MRLIDRQVHSLLESGLTDQDRTDFEVVCRFMDGFLQDIEGIDKFSEDPERFHNLIAAIRDKYGENSEIRVDKMLDSVEAEFDRSIVELEKEWVEEYLGENITDAQIEALVQWKNATAVLPKYLSSKTREAYMALLENVNDALAEKRIAYIEVLFADLSNTEKELCLTRLKLLQKDE